MAADRSRITDIYISHEQPGHVSPPTLAHFTGDRAEAVAPADTGQPRRPLLPRSGLRRDPDGQPPVAGAGLCFVATHLKVVLFGRRATGFDHDAEALGPARAAVAMTRPEDNAPARPATIRLSLVQPGSTGGIGR
jgi:hypothetical protein